ncbi:MAG: hypothetical protein OEV44_01320 [Spirochaetota bacterium]|nr:hypothetical protein [Spirochaetota bacterium]
MTIVELSNNKLATGFVNHNPFVYSIRPAKVQLADYWINTFGAEDESNQLSILINSFIENFLEKYNQVDSLEDCELQERSFFFDITNQILYVHFIHSSSWYTSSYEYGTFYGFSDTRLVYLDNVVYDPLIASVPAIAQQEDIIGYDKLAFINGSIILNNKNAILDSFIKENLYGNDVFLYSIENELIDENDSGSRSDLVNQAVFYIENYNRSLNQIELKVQDQRKAQNNIMPVDKYTQADYPNIEEKYLNKIIPLAYGQIREYLCTPINGLSGGATVRFKQAVTLSSLGTIQVKIDEVWTTKTPSNINLALGEFDLLSTDAKNTSGAIREVKAINSIGIENIHASQIIIDINKRFLGTEFIPSNYDIAEWIDEQESLTGISVVFDKQIEVFEAIRQIQNGSNVGFRYAVKPNKLRTIRIDDETRLPIMTIPNTDIQNINDLPVTTNSELVYSQVEIKYNYDYVNDVWSSFINKDNESAVFANYRQNNTLITETFINNQTDAENRAKLNSDLYSKIPEISELVLMGKHYLSLRIFDIINIELTPGFVNLDNNTIEGRQYYGVVVAKILSIDPDVKNNINNITCKIISDPKTKYKKFVEGNYYGASIYGIDYYSTQREVEA